MLTVPKSIVLLAVLLTAGTLPGQAQQKVRGEMPEGAFVVDPNKVASWNDKTFATAGKEFPVKQFDSRNLERWTHEFPARHSSMGEKSVDMERVELQEWKAGKVRNWAEKQAEIKEVDVSTKSKWSGPLVANEKWARPTKKAESEKKTEEPASDFIVQATIRPLGVPEVQEKLNEYSSPPGERKKEIPSQLQKSSKF